MQGCPDCGSRDIEVQEACCRPQGEKLVCLTCGFRWEVHERTPLHDNDLVREFISGFTHA